MAARNNADSANAKPAGAVDGDEDDDFTDASKRRSMAVQAGGDEELQDEDLVSPMSRKNSAAEFGSGTLRRMKNALKLSGNSPRPAAAAAPTSPPPVKRVRLAFMCFAFVA